MKKVAKVLAFSILIGICIYGGYVYSRRGGQGIKEQAAHLPQVKDNVSHLFERAPGIKISSGMKHLKEIVEYPDKVRMISVGEDVTDQVQGWLQRLKDSESVIQAEEWMDSSLSESEKEELFQKVNMLEMNNMHAVYCGEIEGIQIVCLEYEEKDGHHKNYLQFMVVNNSGLCFCDRADIWETINACMLCPDCGGSGQIMNGTRAACAICGGTGQQFIQNLYYDAIMGWIGGYICCSGCGGSGYIGNVSYNTCSNCMGMGFRID